MKILFITQCCEMYGANKSGISLMLDLRKRYDAEVYTIMPPKIRNEKVETIDQILDREGMKYYCVKMDAWRTNFGKQNLAHIFYYIIRKQIRDRKIVKEIQKNINFLPDIIYSNSSVIDIGFLLACRMKAPHIWHVRESRESHNLKYIYPNNVVRRRFAKSSAVIAISRYIENECKKMRIRQVRCIYNGVEVCKPYEKKYYYNHKVNFVVSGVLNAPKRNQDVIRAARVLVERGYQNFHIYILEDGEEKEELAQMITELKLKEYVDLCGYIKNPQELLRKMDIGIVPSLYEAFGRVTIEYMMNYMAVIGNDTGASPELIQGTEFGQIYGCGKVSELADCMEGFLDMSASIREKGIEARKKAEQFSLKRNTDKIYSLISELTRTK